MTAGWPEGIPRIPDEPWVESELDELAAGYDALDRHGWYDNLDPLVSAAASALRAGMVVVDYSGGTGILARRLLAAVSETDIQLVIVDASAKFLRMAVERLGHDPRVAFRRLGWLDDDARLQTLDEVLPDLCTDGADAILCANAVHLYPDVDQVFQSWRRCVTPAATVLIQSGNIAGSGGISIDDTVRRAEAEARLLVGVDGRYAPFVPDLADAARLAAYDELRDRYFLPIRALDLYVEELRTAGFAVTSVEHLPVDVELAEWIAFLEVYHEGIVGWAGGTERIDGAAPTSETIALRKELLGDAMRSVFPDGHFTAMWTYIEAKPA